MSNTVYNKATFNGQTIIDLSQDTVTSAEHIVSGHTGHLADGTIVPGTAVEGVDMPVFTLVMDANWETVVSATCDRSFADFKEYMDEQPSTDAFCMATISDPIVGDITGNLMVLVMQTSSYITCAFMNGFKPVSDIRYNSNGTITVTSPSSAAQTLTITENGTYQPESDYKSLQEVVVNVPATTPSLQSKTATPSETAQTITADSGYDGLSQVSVGAISSTYVGSGVTRQAAKTVTPTESSQTAVASGVYTTGAVTVGAVSSTYVGTGITRRSSSDLTASGATVTVPSGFYDSQQTKSVASGTAGTPTATKGTVSNHSISITPSVTNTAGYISSGTKTGTAVMVSASELVSGSETKTTNGTYDVTNLAELVVNVPTGGGSTKNVQYYIGVDYVQSSSYTATDVTLTVAKTGTYTVSWIGWRSTSSGTSGSQLYKNNNAYGSATTTFTGTYGQSVKLTGVSLNQGDVLVVRARSRNSSYYMYVGNLIIEETT